MAIEHKWFETMKNTVLYLYEFGISKFHLQDEIKQTSLNWSMCKMAYAQKRQENN